MRDEAFGHMFTRLQINLSLAVTASARVLILCQIECEDDNQ